MKNKDQILIINRFCDEFESQLKTGKDASLDRVFESAKSELKEKALLQSLLSELIALEIVYSDNRKAAAESLRERFPKHGAQIDDALHQRSLLGTVGDAANDTEGSEQARSSVPVASVANVGHRFENLTHHASGGLGDVYVCYDKAVRRKVAIKFLKPKLVSDEQAKKRFMNEGAITGMLEHPGIVPIYDSGVSEDGQPYYAMRLLEGKNLKDAIGEVHDSNGVADFDDRQRSLLRSLTQVCDAISYAHDQGVIHRDLKPANVLLGQYGETMVVDWGLARSMRDGETDDETDSESAVSDETLGNRAGVVTELGQVMGTPAYMSPEQASGDSSKVGKQSDVYSLGSVLYCILTGQPPFRGREIVTQEMIETIQKGDHQNARERNAKVPHALSAICERAMNVDPDSRYDSPKALASDIENWLEDQPVRARPDSLFEKFSRFIRKHRRWSAAATATLVAVAIGSTIATAVINAQSNELAQRKSEAEQQAIVQAKLAAGATESAKQATEYAAHNDEYVRIMNLAFESLRSKNLLLGKGARNASIKDFVEEMRLQLEKRSHLVPAATRKQILGNIIAGLNAAGDDVTALERTRDYIDVVVEMFGETSEAAFDAKGALCYSLAQCNQPVEGIKFANETLELINSSEIPPENQERIGQIKESIMNSRISCLQELERYDEIVIARAELYPWLKTLKIDDLPSDGARLLKASIFIDEQSRTEADIDAIQWQKKLYEAHIESIGPKNPKTLGCLHRLTQAVKRKRGDVAAMPYQKELLEKVVGVLGPTHPNTLTTKGNLAKMMFYVGEYEEFLAVFSEIRDAWAVQPTQLRKLLAVETELVRGHLILGNEKEALDLIRSVVERAIADINIGPVGNVSTTARYFHVVALIENGLIKEAIGEIEGEMEILIAAGDAKKADVDDLQVLLQLAYLMKGDYENALTQREHFKEEISHDNIMGLAQTAEALCGLKKWDEATALINKVLDLPPAEDDRAYFVAESKCMKANLKGLLAKITLGSDPEKAKQLYQEAISELEAGHFVRMPNSRLGRPLEVMRKQLKDAQKQ